MVLNTTGRNRFTTAGHLRCDSGWSWTFRIARVTVHDCKVALLTSQTLARAIFGGCLFDRLPVRIPTLDLPSDSTEKNLSDQSLQSQRNGPIGSITQCFTTQLVSLVSFGCVFCLKIDQPGHETL